MDRVSSLNGVCKAGCFYVKYDGYSFQSRSAYRREWTRTLVYSLVGFR